MSTTPQEYQCEIREVFSGDDLIALVDLGVENLFKRQRIRLHEVDTPNAINAKGDTEGGQIRSEIRQMVRGRKATIKVVNRNASSWIVDLSVMTPDGVVNINALLAGRGYTFKRQG